MASFSSCVNLSRVVLRPGFAAFSGRGGRRGILFPVPSSPLTTQCWHGGNVVGGSVACDSGSFLDHGGNLEVAADHQGIGVAEFLGGKNFLITGGTGFLAKVLIEKIMRTNPDVGKIYVLIKAKDSVAALKRLQSEVLDTELFRCLQEIHGKDYGDFVARKLVPVVGDVREANIGIAPHHLADEIADQVDVIINSAANTKFDERYDVALNINTLGPFRIMSFAQRFRRLKLFLHVSTAYVNGQRQGLVPEKPFRMGDTIAKELGSLSSVSSEHKNVMLNIEEEIKLAFHSRRHSDDDSASFTQWMKDLGLERAKLHGWQDTYVFTKAMGEMVINSMRGDIPVVTIRPSVIESTWRDPFPGWMEGNRMMDPMVLYYGKGQMSSFLADPDGVLDVIPADMVVNAMLASMAKHAGGAPVAAPGLHVYHVCSSTVNPLVIGDLLELMFQHFKQCPYIDAAGQPIQLVRPMRVFDSMERFASYVETNAMQRLRTSSSSEGRARALCAKLVEQAIRLGSIYQPYTFYGGRFDNANTEALFTAMSPAEKASFHFDVRSVDWTDYIINVHIPGLRKHVMKGRGVAASRLPAGTSV